MLNRRAAVSMLLVVVVLSAVPSVPAWGEEGHRYINRVAAQHMPDDMPPFFTGAAARLEFLGPEPDRWRDGREVYSALREVNGPDHFIDIDKAEDFQALPNDRYQYAELLRSRGKDPKVVGFLPYAILEGYEKVQVLFRLWRDPRHASEKDQIEQNIVYYAGVVGHYVADGSMPLHASIHYNGWSTSWNPDQYTREPIHGRFESDYVKAQIKAEDFSGQVKTAQKLPDAFSDIMGYLLESYHKAPEVYRLDRIARWDANNRSAESKTFTTARLAAGAQMLANMWYTAWVDSALPKAEGR